MFKNPFFFTNPPCYPKARGANFYNLPKDFQVIIPLLEKFRKGKPQAGIFFQGAFLNKEIKKTFADA